MELSNQNALSLWSGALAESVRSAGPDLSARQMAILLNVYLGPPPHTVRGLAASLNVSKPAVTRALDTLSKHGFVRRASDPEDKRSILVQRTVKGSVFLSEFSDLVVSSARPIAPHPA
ncbi:MAG: MarR family transcriptional regulator [Proteobacteria bacterium]|nr:MarR family transcriptional regulator [Pseudomonadota bacterium]